MEQHLRSRLSAAVAFFMVSLLALPGWAAQYYVCDCAAGAEAGCVAGSDSNAGTSTVSPGLSYAKARSTFNDMAAGDTVNFCRGGRFTVPTKNRWHNTNCQAATPAR